MEKYITDERTGLKYELVGEYYLIAEEDEPEEDQPIGVWGQRHLRYLKKCHRVRYEGISVGICLYLGTVHKYIFKFCFVKLR